MSYCRCDGSKSNLYVFGNGEEIEIHVQASERIDPDKPLTDVDNWRPFPHELGGKSYYCKTASEALAKVLQLRDAGLKVPDYAIDRLRQEAAAHEEQYVFLIRFRLVNKLHNNVREQKVVCAYPPAHWGLPEIKKGFWVNRSGSILTRPAGENFDTYIMPSQIISIECINR